MKRLIFFTAILLSLSSCEIINRYRMGDAMVSVAGQNLYESSVQDVCSGLTGEDSAKVADAFIHKWATDMLEFDKAKSQFNNDKNIESMVDEYRRSLYIHKYEERLIRERMPKQVSEDSIKAFYERFPERFILKESIMKGLLLVIHKDAPDQQNLKKHLSTLNEENMEFIEKYAYQYASGYELFTDRWETQSAILLRLPLSQGNLNDLLKNSSLIELQDSVSTYLLQVTEKKLAGSPMPLEYATPDIERTLLSLRQAEWIQRERERIYLKAEEQGKIIRK